jgi:hypothetical protein
LFIVYPRHAPPNGVYKFNDSHEIINFMEMVMLPKLVFSSFAYDKTLEMRLQLLLFIKRIIVFQLLFLLLDRGDVALFSSFLYPCTPKSPKRGATHKDDDDQGQDTKHRRKSLGIFGHAHMKRQK